MKYVYLLLLFIPATLVERFLLHTNDSIVFITSCLGIIPLAVIIGHATEQVAFYTGPKIGGFLNATMGNIPELLISGFAVKAGMYTLVLASLAGSILGNIMMVLGLSIFVGGLKYKFQTFNGNIMRSNFILLAFAAFGIMMPFAFNYFGGPDSDHKLMQEFSLILAIIMLVIYILGLIFSLFTHKDIFQDPEEEDDGSEKEKATWSLKKGIGILGITTVLVALMSESLVATVETAAESFGMSSVFVGIVLIPIVGNVAEHFSAVIMAHKNKLDLSIEIAAGSSMQIALFVTPAMVVWSAILGDTMEFVYTPAELFAIIIAIVMALFVLVDKRTNWFEGLQLFTCYIVIAVAFFMFGV